MANFCKKCILKWLPENLRKGKSTWSKLHPRVKRIMINAGYDSNGNKIR